MTHSVLKGGAVALAAIMAVAGADAHDGHDHQAKTGTVASNATAPVLWSNLGSLHYDITTSNPAAQQFFDQGIRLAYGFNHEGALQSFRHAQKLDPDCALCYWGEALVLGPNMNAPMSPDAVGPALAALEKAKALAVGEKEKALIAALATRYSDDPKADRLALDASYADAMVKVAAAYPEDVEVAVLTAEALMDTQPWDYWTASETGKKLPKGRQVEINTLLERALRTNPEHPGAIHFYIHLWEASDTPERVEPYADRLAALMPGAGHIVHMGSHIYYVVGRYAESLELNKVAAAADEAFLAKAKDESMYGGAYYPHNVHFVVVSAQMAGDRETTIAYAEKLAGVVEDEAAATIAWVQPIKAAPYFAHAQYSAPETILALDDPGDTFPFVKGMWHYARGVAFAAKGDVESAAIEAEAISEIATKADLSFLISNYVPGDQLLQIARHVVLGRIAQAEGDYTLAVAEFSEAVKLQDGLPYMEPPYWYYPVRQSLGAALLGAGKAQEAVSVFKESLKGSPNNGWAIFGLKEAQKRLGDKDGVAASEASLSKAWIGPRDLLDLSKL